MRPRVFPAEDPVPVIELTVTLTASMRPRVFPAEDPSIANRWLYMFRWLQ